MVDVDERFGSSWLWALGKDRGGVRHLLGTVTVSDSVYILA